MKDILPIVSSARLVTGILLKGKPFDSNAERDVAQIEALLNLDMELGCGGRVYAAKMGGNTQFGDTVQNAIWGRKLPDDANRFHFVLIKSEDGKKAISLSCVNTGTTSLNDREKSERELLKEYSSVQEREISGDDLENLDKLMEGAGIESVTIQEAVDGMVKDHLDRTSHVYFGKETMKPWEFKESLAQRDIAIAQAMRAMLPAVSEKARQEIEDPAAHWNNPLPYELNANGQAVWISNEKVGDQKEVKGAEPSLKGEEQKVKTKKRDGFVDKSEIDIGLNPSP